MRRPTSPVQRTPPRPPEPRPEASVIVDDREESLEEDFDVALEERDEQITEQVDPIELIEPAPRPAPPAEREPEREPEPRAHARETDAAPDAPSGFRSWRAVRQASTARRRVERGEARRFTARTRRRRQVQLAIAGFVMLVIGGAIAAAYSPLMALRHIEVVGTHSVPAAQVEQALAGELGTPLPLVRSADVRHALDDFRLIESYSTQLEPPSTLVVRITERSPLAVVKSGSSYELVDQAGVVLSAGSRAPAGYPVVRLPAGQQPDHSTSFTAAASVIASLPAQLRKTVTGASAASANDVTLTLSGGKQVLWGDSSDLQLKTADLQALLKGARAARVYDVSSPRAPITR